MYYILLVAFDFVVETNERNCRHLGDGKILLRWSWYWWKCSW